MVRLPISRQKSDTIAAWLEENTGVQARFFKTKITNKFPGLSDSDLDAGVSGVHLYLEATNISYDMQWYGKLDELRSEDQTVWFTCLAPKDFDSSYYQYTGVISGLPEGV